jgi:hypothetical protein
VPPDPIASFGLAVADGLPEETVSVPAAVNVDAAVKVESTEASLKFAGLLPSDGSATLIAK